MYTIQEKLIPINKFSRPGTKITVKGVVIHWTANEGKGADNNAHYNYFAKLKDRYASAHYFVDSKGILLIIPENEMAYHVGAQSYKTKKYGSYPNNAMIGVEMCVNSDGDFNETYRRAVWLCATLLKKYKLSINELERHYDITGKDCPKMFVTDSYGQKYMGMSASSAWNKFKKDVQAVMNGVSPTKISAKETTPSKTTSSSSSSHYPYDKTKGIGTLTILADQLNIRADASFSSAIKKVARKGQVYYVYGEKNGLYDIGGGWVSANAQYVKFTPHPKDEGLYKVQVGAFSNEKYAQNLLNDLKTKGYNGFLKKVGTLYKVQIGAYSNKENAEQLANKIKELGFSTTIIKD